MAYGPGVFLYDDVSAFTQTVYEAALHIARANNVMAQLVTPFSNMRGYAPRTHTIWDASTASFGTITEADDLTPNKFGRTAGGTLTPAAYGRMYEITDDRVNADPEAQDSIMAEAAMDLGLNAALTVERHLLGDLASLTGGTIGAAGTVITWGHIYAARAQMQAASLLGPYFCALHTYQMFQLRRSLSVAGITLNQVPAPADLQVPFTITQVGDITFYETPNLTIDGSGDVTSGFWMREALALDSRQPFRIEPDRDASFRRSELNATMTYAHGVWRPTYGIKFIFDAATPVS